MRVKMLPYKQGSKTARALAKALNIQRVRPDGKYIPRRGDILINWGHGSVPPVMREHPRSMRVLNGFNNVAFASNKLACLNNMSLHGVSVPEYTTMLDTAAEWLQDEGGIVVERHKLQGHSGEGIRLCYDVFDIQPAKLYTRYQKKTHEYRAHVLPNGKVVLNQKRRRRDVPDGDVNWRVRNYEGGFTYCRDNVDPCPEAERQAKLAIEAVDLQFGAVDVLYHKPSKKCVVLEINTAPGLEGSLLTEYVNTFNEVIYDNDTQKV